MDEIIKPAVLTSRAATRDMDTIRARHSEIVEGIKNQSVKIEQFNMQNAVKEQEESTKSNEAAIQKAESDRKTKELEIKEKALYL